MSTKTKVDFLIRNINLPQQRSRQTKTLYEVACVDGNIVAVQAVEPSSRESAFVSDSILDAGGQGLLIPGFVTIKFAVLSVLLKFHSSFNTDCAMRIYTWISAFYWIVAN